MRLYQSFPSVQYSLAACSMESLRELRGAKQGAFNQIVSARVELVRLVVFSAVEFGVHLVTGAIKLTATLIQVPLNPLFGGVSPRVALVDTVFHLVRAIKLVVATPLALLAGIVCPEWADRLYQKFSLAPKPKGLFGNAVERMRQAAKAVWASPQRNSALKGASIATALVAAYWWPLGTPSESLPYGLFLPMVAGGGLFGLGASYCCAKKTTTPPRPSGKAHKLPVRAPTKPSGEAPTGLEKYPVHVLGAKLPLISHGPYEGSQNAKAIITIRQILAHQALIGNIGDYPYTYLGVPGHRPKEFNAFKAKFDAMAVDHVGTQLFPLLSSIKDGINVEFAFLLLKSQIEELRICPASRYECFIGTTEASLLDDKQADDKQAAVLEILDSSPSRDKMLYTFIEHLNALIDARIFHRDEILRVWTPLLLERPTGIPNSDDVIMREQAAVNYLLRIHLPIPDAGDMKVAHPIRQSFNSSVSSGPLQQRVVETKH